VQIIHLQIAGQRSADIPAAASVKLPFTARLLGMEAKARAIGGTAPVVTLNAKIGGDSLLSAPLAVTATAFTGANFLAATSLSPMGRPKLADESVLTIDLDLSGTNPTVDDIDIDLTVSRE
jgi:hypothetical protein